MIGTLVTVQHAMLDWGQSIVGEGISDPKLRGLLRVSFEDQVCVQGTAASLQVCGVSGRAVQLVFEARDSSVATKVG